LKPHLTYPRGQKRPRTENDSDLDEVSGVAKKARLSVKADQPLSLAQEGVQVQGQAPNDSTEVQEGVQPDDSVDESLPRRRPDLAYTDQQYAVLEERLRKYNPLLQTIPDRKRRRDEEPMPLHLAAEQTGIFVSLLLVYALMELLTILVAVREIYHRRARIDNDPTPRQVSLMVREETHYRLQQFQREGSYTCPNNINFTQRLDVNKFNHFGEYLKNNPEHARLELVYLAPHYNEIEEVFSKGLAPSSYPTDSALPLLSSVASCYFLVLNFFSF